MASFDPTAVQTDHASLEGARQYQDIKARLFSIPGVPVRIAQHRLTRRLGAGAMGEVFLAHDDELDRPVAIKLVHARLSDDPRFGERMRQEARALAKLAHPNVVHVYEVGQHQGRFFLVMEYVEGQSLAQWMREGSPTWSEVLDAYLAAGQGLAAAHAVGLTHRDFKPDNVLCGQDRRVCVADFGLARADARQGPPRLCDDPETLLESGEGPSTLDERLSATGAVMGTPAYMPLEQIRGHQVDARSDQFSFCVALYEGLWGARPHVARGLAAQELLLVEDHPTPPPRGTVPTWVWPIVRRGLARDPERRWPDMPSLLEALRRAPQRRRRRQRMGAALLGLPLAFGAGWMALTPHVVAPLDVCAIDPRALAGVWDDARREALREAFAASGAANARASATRIEHALDAWASSDVAEQRSSCEATRVRGTQSDAMLDRRTLCFERRRGELGALVELFTRADPTIVARVGDALAELPDLASCSVAALDAEAEPALDVVQRQAIDAGYRALARARVELSIGRPQLATEQAHSALALAERHRHTPLALEARLVMATITIAGGEIAQGVEQLREVALTATRAELLDLAATARIELARRAAGNLADPRLERWQIDEAQLAIDRVARPHDAREVGLQRARARLAEQAGDFPAAIAAYERAYALAEGRLEPGPRAMLRIGIGTALYRNGELQRARAELTQALTIALDMWGPRAPEVARIRFNLGMVATDLGELDLAEQNLTAAAELDELLWGADSLELARDRFALAYLGFARGQIGQGCAIIDTLEPIYAAKLGLVHDETATVVNAAAVCRYHADDYVGALRGFERALAIQTELLGEDHREVALLHANIGDLQFVLGQLDASLGSHQRALAILAAKLPEDHPELATSLRGEALVWLERGQAARALPELERALAIVDASQSLEVAEIRFALARALVTVHAEQQRSRALELARAAKQGFDEADRAAQAAAVQTWILEQQPRD